MKKLFIGADVTMGVVGIFLAIGGNPIVGGVLFLVALALAAIADMAT